MTSYDMSDRIRKHQPLQRQGLPIDVANAALYLASDLVSPGNGHAVARGWW